MMVTTTAAAILVIHLVRGGQKQAKKINQIVQESTLPELFRNSS